MAIKDWPENERPREKLLTKGAEALSDAELLAIFLRVGAPGKSAIDLARDLLLQFGNLRNLLAADETEFCRAKGLGPAKYVQLQATLEIGRRNLEVSLKKGSVLSNPQQTRQYIQSHLQGYKQEVFAVLFLDNLHQVISFNKMFYGTIHSATVYPRGIVRAALDCNAAAVILAHNHPSGTLEPSKQDVDITKKITKALELMDIRTLDHIIVGNAACVSLAEQGLI